MVYKCPECKLVFNLSDTQTAAVNDAVTKGRNLVRLLCRNCREGFSINPKLILEGKIEEEGNDERLFYCPTSACTGFVEEDKEAKVFGCSECGTEWNDLKSVYKDIEKIIKRYPYRKDVYIKEGDVVKSIPFDDIPKGYYNKVQKEKV